MKLSRWLIGTAAVALGIVWLGSRRHEPVVVTLPSPDRAAVAVAAAVPKPAVVAPTAAEPIPAAPRASEPSVRTGPGRVLPSTESLWKTHPVEPAFARFQDWAARLERATPAQRSALEAEGIALAKDRRGKMSDLIEADPRRALELAVPDAIRELLSPIVLAELETRVQGTGDILVRATTLPEGVEPNGPAVDRTVSIDGQDYRAFVYGERLAQPTFFGVPLHGIALDSRLALAESPVRLVAASAAASASDPSCAVSGASALANGTPLEAAVGDQRLFLCGNAHAEALHDRLLAAAYGTDSTDATGARQLRRTYTEGSKRLIFIRVDFSDLAGAPFSDALGTNMLAGLNTFYLEQSYGKTGFKPFAAAGSAMTPVLRMPNTAAYYGSVDASILRTAARSAATAKGYVLSSYDFDLTCMGAVPGFGWAGLGYIGAPGVWIRSAFDASGGVPAHELGHNLGLFHANYWDTGGQSVTGAGASVEYGDPFDTMGNATAGQRHFNVRSKNFLDWLPNTYVKNVTTTGTYRVFAMDSTNGPTSVRALTIRYNLKTNYWIDVRQKFPSNQWLRNGVGLRWGRTDASPTLLLDTTPGSADGKNDSAVVVGRTYSDRALGVHVTPIAKGGTDPIWVDVAVRFGKPTNDLPPQVTLKASASAVGVGVAVTFDATASDPDDTDLAYAWDFGDGTFGDNAAHVVKAYSVAGEYVARCVVSDLRGMTASASVLVKAGSPNVVHVTGKVTREGQPEEGVRVSVSNTKQTFTDSDGTYILAGLAKGNYSIKAAADGLLFTHPAFVNPLNLQANRAGIDFDASLRGELAQLDVVPMGAVWRYLDRGAAPSVFWKTPSFDDSAWNEGPALLGYGDPDVVTTVGFGPDAAKKFITTWFRLKFRVEDPKAMIAATVGLVRDDGAVVYLNGKELLRSNLPTGTIGAATLASTTVGGTDESTIFETDIDPNLLVAGDNVFAVEVHQSAVDSSDLKFGLRLQALLNPITKPVVSLGATGGSVKVSWPLAAVGFVVEESDSPTGPWTPSDVSVQSTGGLNVFSSTPTDAPRFYRLAKP